MVKKKVTQWQMFLTEMDAIIPWTCLMSLKEPFYQKVPPRKGVRSPMPLETILRVYFPQSWYALSDPLAEEILYESGTLAPD